MDLSTLTITLLADAHPMESIQTTWETIHNTAAISETVSLVRDGGLFLGLPLLHVCAKVACKLHLKRERITDPRYTHTRRIG